MKLEFVYWFTFYNLDSPTVRYRGKYVLDFLKKNYSINSFFIFPSYKLFKIFHFIKAYLSALLLPKTNSLIVIQAIHSNFIYANALKLLIKVRKNISFYDLDDADYLRYSPKTIYHFIKHCTAVTVGSSELLKNIAKINKNTVLIPCPVPDLKIVKKEKNQIFTIGWIGDFGGGHKESLVKFFFPALIDLPFKTKLVFLGVGQKSEYEFLTEFFKNYKNILLEIPQDIIWTNETDIQNRIATFDIGIATLLDNEFYRSKSAFKTKQCFNNGVPVLSSDVPENNVFVQHEINGFLCTTPSDFRQRIIEVNEMSAKQYSALSDAARNTIQKFDLTKFCNDLISTHEKYCTSKNVKKYWN